MLERKPRMRDQLPTAMLRQRDVGLVRLKALTRWSIAAAAVLTGVFAMAAARAFPAGTPHPRAHAGPTRHAAADDSAGTGPLQAPAQAPIPSAAPSVVSGGS